VDRGVEPEVSDTVAKTRASPEVWDFISSLKISVLKVNELSYMKI
jgi:hypothetical protein